MIHIIVVSHYHDKYVIPLINELCDSDVDTSDYFRLYIKDNVNSTALRNFCEDRNVFYIESDECSGFAKNNNLAVDSIIGKFEVACDDYFLLLNPDVLVDAKKIIGLSHILKESRYDLFTVDLFKDLNFSIRDPSVRKFPRIIDFFTSYFFKYNKSIVNREDISDHTIIDWCAGSFLGIKCSVYKKLNGFDENIFMYCEDIDICLRAKKLKYDLVYIPDIKVVHFSQNDNRKLFSKNFVWHLKSIIYLCCKHTLKMF